MISINDRTSTRAITVLNGTTRSVILVGRFAFKFPCVVHGWRNFLRGLIANSMERMWWRSGVNDGLCPVLWSLPGGWLVVMPRCDPVVDVAKVYDAFIDRGDWVIPAENKDDSFGWLGGEDGRLVAVDYG